MISVNVNNTSYSPDAILPMSVIAIVAAIFFVIALFSGYAYFRYKGVSKFMSALGTSFPILGCFGAMGFLLCLIQCSILIPLIKAVNARTEDINAHTKKYEKAVQIVKPLVQLAKLKVSECTKLGDMKVNRIGAVIVWNLSRDSLDTTLGPSPAVGAGEGIFPPELMAYASKGDGPVTVFLVGSTKFEQIGTYSISGAPAYRQSAHIYVVHFLGRKDSGTAVADHIVSSDDPPKSRAVGYDLKPGGAKGNVGDYEYSKKPGIGDISLPMYKWIYSLQSKK